MIKWAFCNFFDWLSWTEESYIYYWQKDKVVAKTELEHHTYVQYHDEEDDEWCNQFWSHFEPVTHNCYSYVFDIDQFIAKQKNGQHV